MSVLIYLWRWIGSRKGIRIWWPYSCRPALLWPDLPSSLFSAPTVPPPFQPCPTFLGSSGVWHLSSCRPGCYASARVDGNRIGPSETALGKRHSVNVTVRMHLLHFDGPSTGLCLKPKNLVPTLGTKNLCTKNLDGPPILWIQFRMWKTQLCIVIHNTDWQMETICFTLILGRF